MTYRKLTLEWVDALLEMRILQLTEEGAENPKMLLPALRRYYETHLADGTFVSWAAVCEGKLVAVSGMSFVEKPPYGGNPSGKSGLLSGMYTRKAYRRQSLAKTLLDHVIEEARAYGCGTVQVTASAMGSLLYADYGFEKSEKFMQIFL